jgi:hypothetical protein
MVMLTAGQQLALEVLKGGNMLAARVLADKVIEECKSEEDKIAMQVEVRESPGAYDGHGVYSWPEFIAFCRRLGVMWDLNTVAIEFRIAEGERVVIKQEYAGADRGPQGPTTDTTNMHNQTFRTRVPRTQPNMPPQPTEEDYARFAEGMVEALNKTPPLTPEDFKP